MKKEMTKISAKFDSVNEDYVCLKHNQKQLYESLERLGSNEKQLQVRIQQLCESLERMESKQEKLLEQQ